MANNSLNSFVKDFANNKIVVTHFCDADQDTVWDMWTKAELLDLWWAPRPWKSETKSMNFKNGGRRIYAMVGPAGERHWAFGDYSNINPKSNYNMKDGFSDENGVVNTQMPQTDWKFEFVKSGSGIKVTIVALAPAEDLKKLVEMGFEEGFTMALDHLDEELARR